MHAAKAIASGERFAKMIPTRIPFELLSWQSVWHNLYVPSRGLSLFLAGFIGLYFLPLIFPVTRYECVPAEALPYYYLASGLLLMGAFLESWNGGMWLLRSRPLWCAVLLTAMICMTVRGHFIGTEIRILMRDSYTFVLLLIVPAVGMRPRNWPWLWVMFFLQMAIGSAQILDAVFLRGATSRSAMLTLEGATFAQEALFMAPLLFLLLPIVKNNTLKIIVLAVFGVAMMRMLFLGNRFAWLLLPVQILMLAYITVRSRAAHRVLELSLVVTVAGILLIPICGALLGSSGTNDLPSVFGDGVSSMMDRMLEKGTVAETIMENERWVEARASMATMEGMDWLIGKGLGATWSSPDFLWGQERNMIHNTWLNCLYWGGIPLLVGVSVPLFWSARIVCRSTSTAGVCCAMFLIFMYLKFPSYLVTSPTLEWILFCLVCGVLMCHDSATPRPTKPVCCREDRVDKREWPRARSSQGLPGSAGSVRHDAETLRSRTVAVGDRCSTRGET